MGHFCLNWEIKPKFNFLKITDFRNLHSLKMMLEKKIMQSLKNAKRYLILNLRRPYRTFVGWLEDLLYLIYMYMYCIKNSRLNNLILYDVLYISIR